MNVMQKRILIRRAHSDEIEFRGRSMRSGILTASGQGALSFFFRQNAYINHVRVRRHESRWHSSFQLSWKRDDDGRRGGSTGSNCCDSLPNKQNTSPPPIRYLTPDVARTFLPIVRRASRCAKWPLVFEISAQLLRDTLDLGESSRAACRFRLCFLYFQAEESNYIAPALPELRDLCVSGLHPSKMMQIA